MTKNQVAVFMDKLVPGSFPKIAGKETGNLKKLGINVELLLIKAGIPAKDKVYLNGLKVNYLEDFAPQLKINFKIPGFSFFSLFHLTSPIFTPLILRKKYDVIIAHGTYTCFTALTLKKFRNIPYIAFLWDPITYILRKVYSETSIKHLLPIIAPFGIKMDKLIIKPSEVVVLPSKYHLPLMEKLTENPIEIVYPGVNSSKKILKTRGDHLIAVARWERGKRPFFLLNVLKKLRELKVSVKLLMVGPWKPPSLRIAFLKKVKEENLHNQIKLYGPAGRQDLPKLYKDAMALIHPISEAFGMIGLEAAAHGCPFLIPKKSGVTDLFRHGIHGFFPQEGNIEEFADYVYKLISDKKLSKKMGQDAWNVAKEHSWKKHAESLVEIIDKYF